jgi:hypothetical protein
MNLLLILLTLSSAWSLSDECTTTREFITTLEFLRNDEDFKMKEVDAQALAYQVASGCTGSAKRFIRIAKTLTRAGANRKSASDTALQFTKGTDSETDAFITSFRTLIAEDSLDMDFQNSARIALSLSKEFQGDLKNVQTDFEKIAKFCSDSTKLALPRNQCGSFAAKVAQSGAKWESGVADSFIKTYEFLKSNEGPSLTNAESVKMAEKIVSYGPVAKDNFSQGFQYAFSKSGLNLTRDQSIQFGLKMAAISEEPKTPTKEKSPEKTSPKQNQGL